jgi:transcriptional regulator with XRE-family HTH domain
VDSRLPFGERVRAIRTAQGLSQEKVNVMMKVNRNFMTSVENGKQNICLDNILKLARILKVSPAEFFELYKSK